MDESLRARLEALNRGPLPFAPTVSVAQIMKSPGAAKTSARSATATIAPAPNGVKFSPSGLMRRGELVRNSAGEHWRICLPLESLWCGGAKLVAGRQEHLRGLLATANQASEPLASFDGDFAAMVAALPDRAVVLDLETCGLAGSALFLIGLLRQVDGAAAVELLLARTFAEEAAVLQSLWQVLVRQDVLVTFNGKSFDWPMVLERTVRHRLPIEQAPSQHLDVLHHARRRWKRELPDCRLQTLERHVCRRHREADIPGHAIPGVYADFVRTGFERDMDCVLYHNAMDLVTLFDLAHRLAA